MIRTCMHRMPPRMFWATCSQSSANCRVTSARLKLLASAACLRAEWHETPASHCDTLPRHACQAPPPLEILLCLLRCSPHATNLMCLPTTCVSLPTSCVSTHSLASTLLRSWSNGTRTLSSLTLWALVDASPLVDASALARKTLKLKHEGLVGNDKVHARCAMGDGCA